jgi:hypothetical protein
MYHENEAKVLKVAETSKIIRYTKIDTVSSRGIISHQCGVQNIELTLT